MKHNTKIGLISALCLSLPIITTGAFLLVYKYALRTKIIEVEKLLPAPSVRPINAETVFFHFPQSGFKTFLGDTITIPVSGREESLAKLDDSCFSFIRPFSWVQCNYDKENRQLIIKSTKEVNEDGFNTGNLYFHIRDLSFSEKDRQIYTVPLDIMSRYNYGIKATKLTFPMPQIGLLDPTNQLYVGDMYVKPYEDTANEMIFSPIVREPTLWAHTHGENWIDYEKASEYLDHNNPLGVELYNNEDRNNIPVKLFDDGLNDQGVLPTFTDYNESTKNYVINPNGNLWGYSTLMNDTFQFGTSSADDNEYPLNGGDMIAPWQSKNPSFEWATYSRALLAETGMELTLNSSPIFDFNNFSDAWNPENLSTNEITLKANFNFKQEQNLLIPVKTQLFANGGNLVDRYHNNDWFSDFDFKALGDDSNRTIHYEFNKTNANSAMSWFFNRHQNDMKVLTIQDHKNNVSVWDDLPPNIVPSTTGHFPAIPLYPLPPTYPTQPSSVDFDLVKPIYTQDASGKYSWSITKDFEKHYDTVLLNLANYRPSTSSDQTSLTFGTADPVSLPQNKFILESGDKIHAFKDLFSFRLVDNEASNFYIIQSKTNYPVKIIINNTTTIIPAGTEFSESLGG